LLYQGGVFYIIGNLPFVAKRMALGDTLKVEYDENKKAYYFDDFETVSIHNK